MQRLLSPGMVPGVCLPLSGPAGFVDVRLRQPIRATAVSLQHIPASIAFDVRSAPRDIVVLGFSGPPAIRARPSADANVHSVSGSASAGVQLVSVQYSLAGPPVQTFLVHNSSAVVDHVRFQVRTPCVSLSRLLLMVRCACAGQRWKNVRNRQLIALCSSRCCPITAIMVSRACTACACMAHLRPAANSRTDLDEQATWDNTDTWHRI